MGTPGTVDQIPQHIRGRGFTVLVEIEIDSSESRSELKTPLQWKVTKAINAVWTYAKKGTRASACSDQPHVVT